MSAVVPVIVEGTYTVLSSGAVAARASSVFSVIARSAGTVLRKTWQAVNVLAGGKAVIDVATGESAAPTPLPGGGGGGGQIPPSVPPAGGSASAGRNLPVPVPRPQTPVKAGSQSVVNVGKIKSSILPPAKGMSPLPVVMTAGASKPVMNATMSAPLKPSVIGIQTSGQVPAAGLTSTMSIIETELTTHPFKTLAIVLGLLATGAVAYGAIKK